jgi:hypothetical protein
MRIIARAGVVCLLLSLLGAGHAAHANNVKRPADGLTFGDKPAFLSDQSFVYNRSDDQRAFDLKPDRGFGTLVGTIVFDGAPKTDAPVSTRVFSAVIPASGKNVRASFLVNGFATVEPGTHATLVLSVNDQHVVKQFRPEIVDEGFVVELKYRAKAVSDVRISVVLLAGRDSAHANASALVAITDITSDAALAQRRATERVKKKK